MLRYYRPHGLLLGLLVLCALVDCGDRAHGPVSAEPAGIDPIVYWEPAAELVDSDRYEPGDDHTEPDAAGLIYKQPHGCGEEGSGVSVEETSALDRAGVVRIKAFYKWRDGTHSVTIFQNNVAIGTQNWGAGCARGSLVVELHEGQYNRGDMFTVQFDSCAGWGPAGAAGQMLQLLPPPPLANDTAYVFWNVMTNAATQWRARGPITPSTGVGPAFAASTGTDAGMVEVEQTTPLPAGGVSVARLFANLDGTPHD